MRTTDKTPTLPFGIKHGNQVRLMEFYTDGDGIIWFKANENKASLEGLRDIAREHREHTGHCIDTGEYNSLIGEMLFSVMKLSPEPSTLATFTSEGWCGTRTFSESIDVTFYAPDTQASNNLRHD